MSILDSIRHFLFGASPEEIRAQYDGMFRHHNLHEEEDEPLRSPSYEWPEVINLDLLPPAPSPKPVPKPPPPPPPVEESTDSGGIRFQRPDTEEHASFRAQLPPRDSGMRFQKGGALGADRDLFGPDSPLNPDIFHECDVRAFCNRLREGVKAVYGGNAVPFYRAAGITRSAYSRLISHPEYHPAKRTVLAMAIALHMDLPAAEDFLRLAGYALSPASREDQIWKYCFSKGLYKLSGILEVIESDT
jgi:hypothetical protein